jgi:hypothetical protein
MGQYRSFPPPKHDTVLLFIEVSRFFLLTYNLQEDIVKRGFPKRHLADSNPVAPKGIRNEGKCFPPVLCRKREI